jgi:hypothetical protein
VENHAPSPGRRLRDSIWYLRRTARADSCDARHGLADATWETLQLSPRLGERGIKLPLSRAARSSSGKGKPQLASFCAGISSSRRYRPPAPATGFPKDILISLVICKRFSCDLQAPPERRFPPEAIFSRAIDPTRKSNGLARIVQGLPAKCQRLRRQSCCSRRSSVSASAIEHQANPMHGKNRSPSTNS